MLGGEARQALLAPAQGTQGVRIARAHQRFEPRTLVALARAEGIGGGQLAHLLPLHLPTHGSSTLKNPRSRSSPRRIRVFTVPSGSPSRAAISAWVKPP